MEKRFGFLAVGLLVSLATPAGAHPHNYVGVVEAVLICDAAGTGYSVGGICFPPGHLAPDAVVTIHDDVSPHVSGSVCQDVDANGTCDVVLAFCDSFSVAALDPALAFLVFFDGAVFGTPLLSLCNDLSMAVKGHADHS